MAYVLLVMARNVTVNLGARSYDIHIGTDILAEISQHSTSLGIGQKVLVVSDSNVAVLYADAVVAELTKAGFSASLAVVPAGEPSKSGETLFALLSEAAARGLDRRSSIIALGGGVVGDLAGFLAASYMRGISYIQVPTSLLAMVDSSVGGKTGVNLPEGKNLVGAFHQPIAVIADLATLGTLPKREYCSGLAEVVKYGAIWDDDFFSLLETHTEKLVALDFSFMETVVERCCVFKADVVSKDEREGGARALLNFGHTLGHAIENVSGYGQYLHGEAVAIGMVFAARVSVRCGRLSESDAERIPSVLKALQLPVTVPDVEWTAIRQAMALDKKAMDNCLKFVLLDRMGAASYGCEVDEHILEEVWHVCRE